MVLSNQYISIAFCHEDGPLTFTEKQDPRLTEAAKELKQESSSKIQKEHKC